LDPPLPKPRADWEYYWGTLIPSSEHSSENGLFSEELQPYSSGKNAKKIRTLF